MLNACAAETSLIVCSTCRLSKASVDDVYGRRGGALLAQALEKALSTHAVRDQVALRPMACLFACSRHCTAYLRSAQRMGYILGDFDPTPAHAAALLDFIRQYLRTADGIVPYANWPQGIKGHFLVRVPPAGMIWDDAAETQAS